MTYSLISIVLTILGFTIGIWYYRLSLNTVEHFAQSDADNRRDGFSMSSQLLFKGLHEVSHGLKTELDRTKVIDDALTATSTSNRTRLRNEIMDGPKMRANSTTNVDAYIAQGRIHVNDTVLMAAISPEMWETYNITPAKILEDFHFGERALRWYIGYKIRTHLSRIGDNSLLRDEDRAKITTVITNLFYRQLGAQGTTTLQSVLSNPNSYVTATNNLNTLIQTELNRSLRRNLNFSTSTSTDYTVGDFVFFRHTILTGTGTKSGDVCADDGNTNNLIVGGKIASINATDGTAVIRYSFIMNPNYNARCANYGYDYDVKPPRWYVQCNGDDCCTVDNNYKIACDRIQMSEAEAGNPNNWFRTYIGGHGALSNGYVAIQGGVSPKGYNLPEIVPLTSLYSTIAECKTGQRIENPPQTLGTTS